MMFHFVQPSLLLAVALLLLVGSPIAQADSPTEEMQKFIDECYLMIDTMGSCEKEWVKFENDIIDSVEGYSKRILQTEELILEESDEILAMADRIVETEQLMSDLTKSCGCEKEVFESSSHRMLHRLRDLSQTARAVTGINSSASLAQAVLTTDSSNSTLRPLTFDHCSAMDQAIEVMDAGIAMMATFNDDFVELLEYLLAGINAMGDQIVQTECLIMDMSRQIGTMADRIVETEQLCADMADSCCQAVPILKGLRGNSKENRDLRSLTSLSELFQGGSKRRQATDGDDICTITVATVATVATNSSQSVSEVAAVKQRVAFTHLRSVLKMLSQKLLSQKIAASSFLISGQTFSRHALVMRESGPIKDFAPGTSDDPVSPRMPKKRGSDDNGEATVVNTKGSDGPMPCDTWWDPFCCAAEVCADMMVEMMELMMSSSDAVLAMCEDCVDEIADLSDVILAMEVQIVDMGLIIGNMSDIIVHIIDEGTECVGEFCEVISFSKSNNGLEMMTEKTQQAEQTLLNLTRTVAAKKGELKTLLQSREFEAKQAKDHELTPSEKVNSVFRANLVSLHKIMAFIRQYIPTTSVGATVGATASTTPPNVVVGGPMDAFGEFAEMVDVCMKMCALMADMWSDQMGVMAHIGDEILELSKDIVLTSEEIVEMSENIVEMEGKMVETEEIMTDLVDCISSH